MYLIVGLGNPEKDYSNTRHNMGFQTINKLAKQYEIEVIKNKFKGLFGSGMIEGEKVILLKPQTFMNLSGMSIRALADYYKIDPEEELIVIYDDVSLEPGKLRVRAKGSAGGHNGIKNIIEQIGTQVFPRIKIGVGEKPEGWDLADYVLSRFPADTEPVMRDALARAAEAVCYILTEGTASAMNKIN